MQLQNFYAALLPQDGAFALFSKTNKRHHWAQGIEELCRLTSERALTSPDWYYATAAFEAAGERTQANVLSKKCFYADIDCGAEKFAKHGAEKTYETQKEALVQVVAFARRTGLTPSLIVSSGAGLHVYWALDRAIGPDEWTACAVTLRAVLVANGLKVDHSCTTDSARVLRPVGALHANGTVVRVINDTTKRWDFVEFYRAVEALAPVSVPVLAAAGRALVDKPASINDDFLGAIEGPPVAIEKVLTRCEALREIAQVRGDVEEPRWRAMLGLVKFAVHGDQLAHIMSSGHPDYDFDDTQAKLDRYQAGPTSCQTFAAYTDACTRCEHQGKIKSPILLGRMTVEETAVAGIPEPEPAPSVRVATLPTDVWGRGYRIEMVDGEPVLMAVVRKEKEGIDGTEASFIEVPLTANPFWLHAWTESTEQGDVPQLSMRRWKAGRIYQSLPIPARTVMDQQKLLNELADREINPFKVSAASKLHLQNYMNDQTKRIRYAAARPVIRRHNGFQKDTKGEMICALGQHVICKGGKIKVALLSEALAQTPFGMGRLPPVPESFEYPESVWADIVRPGAEQQSAFLAERLGSPINSLAASLLMSSPMMLFTAESEWGENGSLPPTGFTVSLYSPKGGHGKTTTMRVAAEVYGPVPINGGGKDNTTDNARIAMTAACGTLPFTLDEVTSRSVESGAALINTIAGGIEKARATKTGGLQRTPITWSLVSMVTTNSPQRELLKQAQESTDALQLRLMELDYSTAPKLSPGEMAFFAPDRAKRMSANHGHLGAMIALYCVTHGYEAMRVRGQKHVSDLFLTMPDAQVGRFFVRALASVKLLFDVLEELNLMPFRREEVEASFLSAYKDMLRFRADNELTAASVLRKLLSHAGGNIAVTRTMSNSGMRDVVENERTLRAPLAGRRVLNLHTTFITSNTVQQWCTDNRFSMLLLLKQGVLEGVLRIDKRGKPLRAVNITAGIEQYVGTTQLCIMIDDARLSGRSSADLTNVASLTLATAPREVPPENDLSASR